MDYLLNTVFNNPSWVGYYFEGEDTQKVLFEDEQCFVIDNENRKESQVHFLVLSKKTTDELARASVDDGQLLGHMLSVAKQVATNLSIDKLGYHIRVDENYQEKNLKALHVFDRALNQTLWPAGPGPKTEEAEDTAQVKASSQEASSS